MGDLEEEEGTKEHLGSNFDFGGKNDMAAYILSSLSANGLNLAVGGNWLKHRVRGRTFKVQGHI